MKSKLFKNLGCRVLIVGLLSASVSGLVNAKPSSISKHKPGNTVSVRDLLTEDMPQRLQQIHTFTGEVDYLSAKKGEKIRLKALRRAAYNWGLQEGQYHRSGIINEYVESKSIHLHNVFDFNKFVVDGKMLMPSIIQAERIFEQIDPTNVRTVKISYTLKEAARLIQQPPTWRDWLILNVDEPQKPHESLFPRTDEETLAWVDEVNRGWDAGVVQADEIFEFYLRQLQDKIEGRYRYRKLLAMSVVTLPKVRRSTISVEKVDSGKTINLNDTVYSITNISEFTDTEKWSPYFKN